VRRAAVGLHDEGVRVKVGVGVGVKVRVRVGG